LALSLKLLQRLDPHPARALIGEPSAIQVRSPLQPATPAKRGADSYPLHTLLSLVRRQMIEQIRDGDISTNDVVDTRGRLGTQDSRDLKINGRPPLKLDRREHLVLSVLAQFARYVAEAARADKGQLSAFLAVSAIVPIVFNLTRAGGSLFVLWPAPIESDVFRNINKTESRLRSGGFNLNLIESGHRGTGYRPSTPLDNLILEAGQELSEWC
jgi:hypothetical protein